MSTDVIDPPEPSETMTITVTDVTIEQLRNSILNVKLQGVDVDEKGSVTIRDADAMLADRAGLKFVKELRSKARTTRTTCEKEHAAIKEDALRECQRIDKSRRDMVGKIQAFETRLVNLENAVENELDRRAKIEADKRWEARRQALLDLGAESYEIDETRIRRMDDGEFTLEGIRVSALKKQRWEAEQERERIAAEQKLEADRLAAEKMALDAQRADLARLQKIETDKLEAQRAELQKMREQQEHEARLLQSSIEANRLAEENRQAAERQKIAAEQEKLEESARRQREEADRLEAERLQMEHDQQERALMEQVRVEREQAEEILFPYESIKAVPETYAGPWQVVAATRIRDLLTGDGIEIDESYLPKFSEIMMTAVAEA